MQEPKEKQNQLVMLELASDAELASVEGGVTEEIYGTAHFLLEVSGFIKKVSGGTIKGE